VLGGRFRRREGNFGPDAPPRGKKRPFAKAERGPKGPIRIKTNSRIYSTEDLDDAGGEFEGDDFATSAAPDDDASSSDE